MRRRKRFVRLHFNLLILLLFAWKFMQHLRFPVAHNITPNRNSVSVSIQHLKYSIFFDFRCYIITNSWKYTFYDCILIRFMMIKNQNTRKCYYQKFIVWWSNVNRLFDVFFFFLEKDCMSNFWLILTVGFLLPVR